MAGNESEINLRFKVSDDGSVVLDKIGKSIQNVDQHTKSMNSSLGIIKFDSIVNLAERAFQAGEQMYNLAKSTASALNDIERSAKVANMTTDEYQKMAFAAKMSDVSIEELSTGMKKLSMNMDDASKGSGEAADKFERIGVSVTDSSGKMKGLNEIMLQIAEKFSTWEDGPRKIAIAVDLFGKSGERLIPYLNQGAAGIKGFYEEAERLGIVLDEKMIKAGSELEDKFKKLESWWTSLKNSVVMNSVGIVEAAGSAFDSMRGFIDKFNLKIESTLGIQGEATAKMVEDYLKAIDAEDAAVGKRMTSMTPKSQAPAAGADPRKAQEETLKIIRKENLGFLEKEEATLKRLVELQTQRNKGENEALAIAERLGVSTKASLTQWIETDMVGEYEKLLGSGLFSGKEMEQFKERYTEALKGAMEGGWGTEPKALKQMEEAIGRIKDMKIEDTGLEKARQEADMLTIKLQELSAMRGEIVIYDDGVIKAREQVDGLRNQLEQLQSQSWNINMAITGSGSSQLPIMDKISEVTNAFKQMGAGVGNMVLNMNMEQITAGITSLNSKIVNAFNIPILTQTGPAGKYVIQQKEKDVAMWKAQIAGLEKERAMLTAAGSYAAAPAAPAAAAAGGGGGGGGYGGGDISVNIGVINVNGANAAEVATDLDAQLADLYLRDRSKLKNAIEGSA